MKEEKVEKKASAFEAEECGCLIVLLLVLWFYVNKTSAVVLFLLWLYGKNLRKRV